MNQIVSLLLILSIPICVSAQVTPQGEIISRDRGKEGAEGFVGWVEYTHLFWQKYSDSGLPNAESKILSLNHSSSTRSQITRLPAGWSHSEGYHSTNEEIFVLDGDLSLGGKLMTKYSFAYFPAGYVHGPVRGEFQFWTCLRQNYRLNCDSAPVCRFKIGVP